MMKLKHPHFRLRVDLSKFFHDARRYCWIFVDGTKILQVMHLNQHISKLFNITEPFHLLLNDNEYLPPAEDVRLLENNETVLVVRGSGISNDTVVHKMDESNDSVYDKEIQICDIKKNNVCNKLDIADNILNNTQQTSINNTRDVTFYSVIDEDVDNEMHDDDTEQDTDFKVTDNFTEDCNGTESVKKRKRVRKRRPKNRSSLIASPLETKEENTSKKPKIVDSYIIPTAKHIRFDVESKENNIAKHIVQETSTNEFDTIRTSSKELSMLLSLGQSSTPITFVNRKMKHDTKVDTVSNNGINKNLNKIIEEDSLDNKSCNENANEKPQCFKNIIILENNYLEKRPILVGKPRVTDVIAFKTLKIGTDYTPQLSNFIVTKVLDFCEKTSNYTLKILHGKEEVQVPFGKFSLSDDESAGQPTDTFILNFSQMNGIRLVNRCVKDIV